MAAESRGAVHRPIQDNRPKAGLTRKSSHIMESGQKAKSTSTLRSLGDLHPLRALLGRPAIGAAHQEEKTERTSYVFFYT